MRIGNEVETLYTNGPAGGGGACEIGARGRCGVVSTLVPRAAVDPDPFPIRWPEMKLRELAHARTGDKGDISNISVIAYDPGDFAFCANTSPPTRVKAHFADIVHGAVERYELPGLGALNFVLHAPSAAGVTRSLALDAHGKSLSSSPAGDGDARPAGADRRRARRTRHEPAAHAVVPARRAARPGDRRRARHRPGGSPPRWRRRARMSCSPRAPRAEIEAAAAAESAPQGGSAEPLVLDVTDLAAVRARDRRRSRRSTCW